MGFQNFYHLALYLVYGLRLFRSKGNQSTTAVIARSVSSLRSDRRHSHRRGARHF